MQDLLHSEKNFLLKVDEEAPIPHDDASFFEKKIRSRSLLLVAVSLALSALIAVSNHLGIFEYKVAKKIQENSDLHGIVGYQTVGLKSIDSEPQDANPSDSSFSFKQSTLSHPTVVVIEDPNENFEVQMEPDNALRKKETASEKASTEPTTLNIRPHIFFILIDDQGYADMGYNSADEDLASFTPTLDSLAKEGIVLENYYTQQMCTPARAALLSGRYPAMIGMDGLALGPTEPWGLPLDLKLLPEYLQENGYSTHIVGKWHLGFFREEYLPTKRGFDSHFGFYSGKENYYSHMLSETNKHRMYYDWFWDGKPYKEAINNYSTQLIEERTRTLIQDFVDGDGQKPLFVYLSHQNVHEPEDPPPDSYISAEAQSKIESLPESRQLFAKMTLALDQSVATLVQDLKDAGIYDQSLIVVASDNGGCTGHGGQNYPLRGQKNSLFEGGVKVNSFVYSPLLSGSTKGTRFRGLFHVSDWMPTLISGMLGASVDGDLDGINLWGPLLGSSRPEDIPREEILHGFEISSAGKVRAALRVGNLKILYGEGDQGWYKPQSPDQEGLCVRRSLDTYPFSSNMMIFNLDDDPYEQHNLINNGISPTIKSELWMKLMRFKAKLPQHAYSPDDGKALSTWDVSEKFTVPWHISV